MFETTGRKWVVRLIGILSESHGFLILLRSGASEREIWELSFLITGCVSTTIQKYIKVLSPVHEGRMVS